MISAGSGVITNDNTWTGKKSGNVDPGFTALECMVTTSRVAVCLAMVTNGVAQDLATAEVFSTRTAQYLNSGILP
jgi:hypothetical protein